MVNVLSTNRNLEDEVEKGVKMLSVDMEKTPFYRIAEERGALQMAATMIKEFNLSVDAVAKKLNISIDELKKYINDNPHQNK